MKNMEIERKFTVKNLPLHLDNYEMHHIEQAYLNTDPVIRIRKEDSQYTLTYKGKGLLSREEYNLPLNEESYYHLRKKADGTIISKKRYLITELSSSLTIELDLFDEPFAPLIIAEVEFSSIEESEAFTIPSWFDQEVTYDAQYHNSNLSKKFTD